MSSAIEAVTVQGRDLWVTARQPAVEPRALALAAAIRVFDRYPVFDRLILTVGEAETGVSREDVERLLGAEGFAAVRERGRWRQLLADLARARTEEGAE